MAEHVFSLLCSQCIVDQRSNNLTLVSVTEQLNIEALPSEVPDENSVHLAIDLALVTLWRRSDQREGEQVQVRVQIVAPDGKVAGHYDYHANLLETVRTRHILKIVALPFHGFGTYQYVVRVKEGVKSDRWKKLSSIPVDVVPGVNFDFETTFLRSSPAVPTQGSSKAFA